MIFFRNTQFENWPSCQYNMNKMAPSENPLFIYLFIYFKNKITETPGFGEISRHKINKMLLRKPLTFTFQKYIFHCSKQELMRT